MFSLERPNLNDTILNPNIACNSLLREINLVSCGQDILGSLYLLLDFSMAGLPIVPDFPRHSCILNPVPSVPERGYKVPYKQVEKLNYEKYSS